MLMMQMMLPCTTAEGRARCHSSNCHSAFVLLSVTRQEVLPGAGDRGEGGWRLLCCPHIRCFQRRRAMPVCGSGGIGQCIIR